MGLSTSQIESFFSSTQPFKALPTIGRRRLAFKTRERLYPKGATIYNEGEEADSVWVIYKGRVLISKYTRGYKPLVIESLGPGELFGTLCRLGGNGRCYPCTAIAKEPTAVLRILDRTFLEYYTKSPGMMQGICSLCSERLKNVQDLRCSQQESVFDRLADILLRLYETHGETLPFTKMEISQMTGTAVETIFRTLKRFQERGILASSRGKILIKKPEELKSLVEKT